jgi:AcrR family transcriptional regulator
VGAAADSSTRARGDLEPLPGGSHGLSADEVAASQRKRLIAAVVALVAERGYDGTAITEIARHAAVANRAFYAIFDSKDDAIIAAFDGSADELSTRIAETAGAAGDWPQQVIAGLRELVEFFDADPVRARFCLVAPFTTNPEIMAHCRGRLAAALSHLSAGRSLHSEDFPLPASTEDSLIGGIVAQLGRTAQSEGEFASQLPGLVEFVLAPYLGIEAARSRAAAV